MTTKKETRKLGLLQLFVVKIKTVVVETITKDDEVAINVGKAPAPAQKQQQVVSAVVNKTTVKK